MTTKVYKRYLPILLLGALIIPIASAWGGTVASTSAAKGNNASPIQILPQEASAGDSNAILAGLTSHWASPSGESMDALGLTSQTIRATTQQTQTAGFANPAFQRIWERTDRPVAAGQVQRSWYWGPTPISAGLQEDYAQGAGGKRLVQYFDKSRMEINNPAGDANSRFFVTNGLLAVELISGKVQVGDAAYQDRYQADIPLASDADDATAPTYLSFANVSNTPLGDRPATSTLGMPATMVIARDGTVTQDATKATYPRVNIAYYEGATKHNIPQAIWEFLNESGPVYNPANGQTANERLSDPWFYATGLPISEAYWARVKIAGQPQDVLIQAFERRIVTYVPNGVPGYRVQMGNIGRHYYDWRYKEAGRPTAGAPTPGPTQGPPAATATAPAGAQPTATQAPPPPTAAPSDPNTDCSNIPASRNATVVPNCGRGGTGFRFEGRGFQPNENVGIYITAPDQSVIGAPFQAPADSTGRVVGIGLQSQSNFPAGIWAITFEGTTSRAVAIGYFKITALPSTPTRPPAATAVPGGTPAPLTCDTSGTVNGRAVPPAGRSGDVIRFTATGFRQNEDISFWFTLPTGEVEGTTEPVPLGVNPDGSIGPLPIDVEDLALIAEGRWAVSFQGADSNNLAVIYFCVYE